jgi:hypothetical protein
MLSYAKFFYYKSTVIGIILITNIKFSINSFIEHLLCTFVSDKARLSPTPKIRKAVENSVCPHIQLLGKGLEGLSSEEYPGVELDISSRLHSAFTDLRSVAQRLRS